MIRRFIVKKNERGILFKEGDFIRFLEPDTYHFLDPFKRITVETYDTSLPEFQHSLLDFWLKHHPDLINSHLTPVELTDQQVALVYQHQHLVSILPPNTRIAYWKGTVDVQVELFDISTNFQINPEKAKLLVHTQNPKLKKLVNQFVYYQMVPEHQVGLLYLNGQHVGILSPGLHAYWNFNHELKTTIWDTRLQEIEMTGQEILTKDKVTLRVNCTLFCQIQDIVRAISVLPDINDHLYKEMQFGLRAAIGTRTLDELLENKTLIDEQVFAYLREKTADMSILIKSVGVKDLILPGEMRTILNRVVEAEKSAQANVIRRREETAATRSLLNTAKVMEGNPIALRLKELETLEKVTEKIDKISVFSGLEGLMKDLINIR